LNSAAGEFRVLDPNLIVVLRQETISEDAHLT